MLQYIVKKGFGTNKTKEFFVAERDGDTIEGYIAGPFENKEQGYAALDSLQSLHDRRLIVIAGHLIGTVCDWQANGARLAEEESAGE